MRDGKVRVGVAGVGFVGITHLQAYQQITDVQLVGIADPDDQRGNAAAAQAGCPRYRTYAEMLAQADLDVINVCLPPALHLEAAQAAAQAGVHVLMEKPLARTLAEAALIPVHQRTMQESGDGIMISRTMMQPGVIATALRNS